MATELNPLKKYIPEELELDLKEPSEVEEIKSVTIEDSSLMRYVNDDTVRVQEVKDYEDELNLEIPKYVIEKKAKKPDNELCFGILMDELNAAPEILYTRKDENEEVRYGSPFLVDSGMFRDVNFNSFNHFLNYVESVGEAYGPLNQSDIIHDDLIGMRRSGKLKDTPYLRNVLVSGIEYKADLIDFEDAYFEDSTKIKQDSKHIKEMNPSTTAEEYQSILKALICEGIDNLDIFEREFKGSNSKGELDKRFLLSHDENIGLDFVDLEKLLERTNPDFSNLIRQVGDRFESGVLSGFNYVNDLEEIEKSTIEPEKKDLEKSKGYFMEMINDFIYSDTNKELTRKKVRDRKTEIDEWLEFNLQDDEA